MCIRQKGLDIGIIDNIYHKARNRAFEVCLASLAFHQGEDKTLSCTTGNVNASWMKSVIEQQH